MKTKTLILLIFMSLFASTVSCSQPKIIFDTDIGGDADDLGALVMLNHFIDRGECDLLAVMCWSTEKYAVSAIDAVNRFYGHPDIPLGARKDGTYHAAWNYTKAISDHFPHELNHDNVPDAVVLYRKILAGSPDSSIVIVTVGPLKNIEDLLRSGSDTISGLTGKELIDCKVKEFVMMGGQYPEGDNEWNFNGDMPGVTEYVISNLSVPLTFSGYELGEAIKTGEVFNDIDPDTPLYVGFMHFSKNAPWMKYRFRGRILDNSTFDQTAVLYAVRGGVNTYWDRVSGGRCVPDDKGGNKWVKDSDSNHSYLVLKMDSEKIAKHIERFMLGNF
ncbi:MAG: nucleoside hydrolase [Bacteroidota bacterium]